MAEADMATVRAVALPHESGALALAALDLAIVKGKGPDSEEPYEGVEFPNAVLERRARETPLAAILGLERISRQRSTVGTALDAMRLIENDARPLDGVQGRARDVHLRSLVGDVVIICLRTARAARLHIYARIFALPLRAHRGRCGSLGSPGGSAPTLGSCGGRGGHGLPNLQLPLLAGSRRCGGSSGCSPRLLTGGGASAARRGRQSHGALLPLHLRAPSEGVAGLGLRSRLASSLCCRELRLVEAQVDTPEASLPLVRVLAKAHALVLGAAAGPLGERQLQPGLQLLQAHALGLGRGLGFGLGCGLGLGFGLSARLGLSEELVENRGLFAAPHGEVHEALDEVRLPPRLLETTRRAKLQELLAVQERQTLATQHIAVALRALRGGRGRGRCRGSAPLSHLLPHIPIP
mmetsp:Transcript_129787/g.277007  ORF Transcript_129787/g.277007 Transcript_129787/m.277007 type:complete len:409 (+) Transcript_129787:1561-2787(+)